MSVADYKLLSLSKILKKNNTINTITFNKTILSDATDLGTPWTSVPLYSRALLFHAPLTTRPSQLPTHPGNLSGPIQPQLVPDSAIAMLLDMYFYVLCFSIGTQIMVTWMLGQSRTLSSNCYLNM